MGNNDSMYCEICSREKVDRARKQEEAKKEPIAALLYFDILPLCLRKYFYNNYMHHSLAVMWEQINSFKQLVTMKEWALSLTSDKFHLGFTDYCIINNYMLLFRWALAHKCEFSQQTINFAALQANIEALGLMLSNGGILKECFWTAAVQSGQIHRLAEWANKQGYYSTIQSRMAHPTIHLKVHDLPANHSLRMNAMTPFYFGGGLPYQKMVRWK